MTKQEYLEQYGWEKEEVSYNQFGHTTREGWTHPSKVFKRPVSIDKAYEFEVRYQIHKMFELDDMDPEVGVSQ